MSALARSAPAASFTIEASAGGRVLSPVGAWEIDEVGRLFAELEPALHAPAVARGRVTIELGGLSALDTAGAWLLYRTAREFRLAGYEVRFSGGSADHSSLLDLAAGNDEPCLIEPEERNILLRLLEDMGAATLEICRRVYSGLGFLGLFLATMARAFLRPRRAGLTALVYHMEMVGLRAMPIVALISFLIGVVVAYQGAVQLRRFGAEIFVVDLVGISVLRELGGMLTAVVLAGRSGSAFTAQLGSMCLNQEIDAMRTIGLDPIERLVAPRVIALALMMPLLTFLSDMLGIAGGALMAWISLNVTPAAFIERLNFAVSLWSFWIGIIKAPVFAIIIGLIGCYEGLAVRGGAEGLGHQTTKSVVEAIFLVIVSDAVFSVFFAIVGV